MVLTITNGAQVIFTNALVAFGFGNNNAIAGSSYSNVINVFSSVSLLQATTLQYGKIGQAEGSFSNILNIFSGATNIDGTVMVECQTTNDSWNIANIFGGTLIVTNPTGGAVLIGTNGATANSLTLSNGATFLGANVTVGYGPGSSNNSYNVVGLNGAVTVSNNLITVGGGGGSFNTLTITNATVLSRGLAVGNGSSNNTVTVQGNVTWNVLGGVINIGNAANSLSNTLSITGATVSNAGLVTVGGAVGNGGFNQLTITKSLFQSQGLNIGNSSSNNTVNVLGSTWNLSASNLTIGSLAAAGNSLTIDNSVLTNGGLVTIGGGKAGSPNTNAVGNSLLINNGAQLWAGSLRAGLVAGDNNNSVQLLNGSLLEANSLVIAAGTSGNTISNRNSTYEFTTATPTVTPGAAGIIAINNGTISFRGINNADVTANQGAGALSGISFAGTNTFMLNASSNINASAAQDYTFQVVPGNPSNYVNLVMVNGQTEYGGGNLTIGGSGSLLISNTTAGIDGNFVNSGTASVINATANFANTINNHGRLTLQNATLNTTALLAINFPGATLHGNGTITSDLNNLGTISPVGTLNFSGNLTLFSSSVVVMELTGYGNGVGTNDVLNVSGNFQYFGTLTVTNTTGFAYAYGQHFYLFNFGIGDQIGDFSVTNLPNLMPGLAWNTAQLDTSGLLIIVPEPSTIVLLICGVLLVIGVSRRSPTPPQQQ